MSNVRSDRNYRSAAARRIARDVMLRRGEPIASAKVPTLGQRWRLPSGRLVVISGFSRDRVIATYLEPRKSDDREVTLLVEFLQAHARLDGAAG